MWGYDVEVDVSDLKSIAFDYIRLGLDQTDFRDIIRKPTKAVTEASLFSNEQIWRDFSDAHFDVVESVEEESVDDIIRDNPTGDIGRLLRARDTAWRKKVGQQLHENFQRSRDKLTNRQHAAEPIKLMQKALEALAAVDTAQSSFQTDPGIRQCISDIDTKLREFEIILNQ